MTGFFNSFRQKVISAVDSQARKSGENIPPSGETVDNLISLGVLLWVVAQADEKFLPAEKSKIKEALNIYGKISEKDMPIVLRAIEEASIQRVDLHAFTKEVGRDLAFKVKMSILENLFRIACVDRDLDHQEHEMIRKIAGLLKMEHRDFIDTKIRIKKEFGLDTAGL